MLTNTISVLLILIGLSLPVATILFVVGVFIAYFYAPMPVTAALGEITWSTSQQFLLVAVPMFILLGEILLRAGIASRMYDSMAKWVSWLPGGLMHSNIGTCAIFAATSGSSVATAATVSTVSLPLVKQHQYNERLFLGTLSAGGTLGILIPPSINLIIYAVLTDTSIPQLYLAGIIPGVLMAGLFMALIAVLCIRYPPWGGRRMTATWRERVVALIDLIPPACIFLLVVGSIYAGLATPTEAASLGVIGALVLAWLHRSLSWAMIREALINTMRTTSMVMLIVISAYFLNFVMSMVGLNDKITNLLVNSGLSAYEMLFAIVIFYLVLGCFMDTLAMMVATIPVTAPVMFQLGFDPIWYGIVIIVLVELALITPPFGMNLFVVQSRRADGSVGDVMLGSLPFVGVMFVMLLLLTLFPNLALWLPAVFWPS